MLPTVAPVAIRPPQTAHGGQQKLGSWQACEPKWQGGSDNDDDADAEDAHNDDTGGTQRTRHPYI